MPALGGVLGPAGSPNTLRPAWPISAAPSEPPQLSRLQLHPGMDEILCPELAAVVQSRLGDGRVSSGGPALEEARKGRGAAGRWMAQPCLFALLEIQSHSHFLICILLETSVSRSRLSFPPGCDRCPIKCSGAGRGWGGGLFV